MTTTINVTTIYDPETVFYLYLNDYISLKLTVEVLGKDLFIELMIKEIDEGEPNC